jgi:ABC-type protease/lipase transport system fused ATPase/permease subunit
MVVLDEPNSNLDGEGDIALARCIQQLKQRGVTVVLVAHQPSTLGVADKLLVMHDGAVAMFGPKGQVLEKLQPRPRVVARSQ